MAKTQNKHIDKGQNWFIAAMKKYGFETAVFGGVCFGVSMMAAQAALAGDLSLFDARLFDIFDAFLNTSAEIDVNIAAFFNGIQLYQQPHLYADVFSKHGRLYQSASTLWPFTYSTEFENNYGHMYVADNFAGAYNKSELTNYFSSLENTIRHDHSKQPVALTLRDFGHAISVIYDRENNEWLLVDIEQAPIKRFKTSGEIAAAVRKAFGSSDNTIFSTTICATENQRASMTSLLTAWKAEPEMTSIQAITKEKLTCADKHGATLLFIAIHSGDVATTKKLIAQGVDVNRACSEGSPLYVAAHEGNFELTKLLLEHGALPNHVHPTNGESPLYTAAQQGYNDIVAELLKYKANPELRCHSDDTTALYVATLNKHQEAVTLLLQHGAKPDAVSTPNKWSPLHIAAWKGQSDMVQVLLDGGAKPSKNTIQVAEKCGHLGIAHRLRNHVSIASRATRFFTKLQKSTPATAAISCRPQ